jgi:hypothetical protein
VIGLFKTELARRRGPGRTVEHVEAAAALHGRPVHETAAARGQRRPPQSELEQTHCRHLPVRAQDAGLDESLASFVDTNRASGDKACGCCAPNVERVVIEKQHPLSWYGQ